MPIPPPPAGYEQGYPDDQSGAQQPRPPRAAQQQRPQTSQSAPPQSGAQQPTSDTSATKVLKELKSAVTGDSNNQSDTSPPPKWVVMTVFWTGALFPLSICMCGIPTLIGLIMSGISLAWLRGIGKMATKHKVMLFAGIGLNVFGFIVWLIMVIANWHMIQPTPNGA